MSTSLYYTPFPLQPSYCRSTVIRWRTRRSTSWAAPLPDTPAATSPAWPGRRHSAQSGSWGRNTWCRRYKTLFLRHLAKLACVSLWQAFKLGQARGQYYKRFYLSNLNVYKLVFPLVRPFQPILMFVRKDAQLYGMLLALHAYIN